MHVNLFQDESGFSSGRGGHIYDKSVLLTLCSLATWKSRKLHTRQKAK